MDPSMFRFGGRDLIVPTIDLQTNEAVHSLTPSKVAKVFYEKNNLKPTDAKAGLTSAFLHLIKKAEEDGLIHSEEQRANLIKDWKSHGDWVKLAPSAAFKALREAESNPRHSNHAPSMAPPWGPRVVEAPKVARPRSHSAADAFLDRMPVDPRGYRTERERDFTRGSELERERCDRDRARDRDQHRKGGRDHERDRSRARDRSLDRDRGRDREYDIRVKLPPPPRRPSPSREHRRFELGSGAGTQWIMPTKAKRPIADVTLHFFSDIFTEMNPQVKILPVAPWDSIIQAFKEYIQENYGKNTHAYISREIRVTDLISLIPAAVRERHLKILAIETRARTSEPYVVQAQFSPPGGTGGSSSCTGKKMDGHKGPSSGSKENGRSTADTGKRVRAESPGEVEKRSKLKQKHVLPPAFGHLNSPGDLIATVQSYANSAPVANGTGSAPELTALQKLHRLKDATQTEVPNQRPVYSPSSPDLTAALPASMERTMSEGRSAGEENVQGPASAMPAQQTFEQPACGSTPTAGAGIQPNLGNNGGLGAKSSLRDPPPIGVLVPFEVSKGEQIGNKASTAPVTQTNGINGKETIGGESANRGGNNGQSSAAAIFGSDGPAESGLETPEGSSESGTALHLDLAAASTIAAPGPITLSQPMKEMLASLNRPLLARQTGLHSHIGSPSVSVAPGPLSTTSTRAGMQAQSQLQDARSHSSAQFDAQSLDMVSIKDHIASLGAMHRGMARELETLRASVGASPGHMAMARLEAFFQAAVAEGEALRASARGLSG